MKVSGKICSPFHADDIQQAHKLCLRREFSLVRLMAMNISYAPKHLERNIRDETGGGVGFLETV